MPFGLTMNTRPFADICPMIAVASWPSTRLSVTDWLFGWAKVTLSDAAMPNPCQLITAFWLDWVMVIAAGATVMTALPAATTPPPGSASAALGIDINAAVMQPASR